MITPKTVAQVDVTDPGRPRDFHSRLPDYRPSNLVELPTVAAKLGIAEAWVKDESARMGLPSFKVLGASWATYRALEEAAGGTFDGWRSTDELARMVQERTKVRRLSAATDGNHGRAVARMATWLGMTSDIFVPLGTVDARIRAIESEGATVTVVDGSYDQAVARAAEEAGEDCFVISDTSWEGYRDIPGWVIDGYSSIFDEAEEQFAQSGRDYPDAVVVQIGVGALAAAVVRYHRGPGGPGSKILGVEPESAACVLASVRGGEMTSVPGPHPSIIAGLNCDSPSVIAWPHLSTGIDAYVAISDDDARQAMRDLAAEGIVSGETGAAGLAGLTVAASIDEIVETLALDHSSRVLIISTEGATDEAAFATIVGRSASAVAAQ
ncbi:diaminopropionate ammonia-lyase [Pseudactinotalea sp. HY158]|uniref:diaminopropionate ammonia-lyase n=1 Tax=Pseudactinotalea sp. HY158 TaxID=2654547 RepID=UPI001E2D60A1|nr:diaminopropionate ammonia-lyase [Pseudactinotalea sp. HY158]